MNYDVNKQQMLQAGAQAQEFNVMAKNGMAVAAGWANMASAPRDGTPVEIMNTYGVAPTYSLCAWTDEVWSYGEDGLKKFKASTKSWQPVDGKGGSPSRESSLLWRPYLGDPKTYVDPTHGAQYSPAYWRGAVAREAGLPIGFFEAETAQNIAKLEPVRKPLLHRVIAKLVRKSPQ